LYYRLSTVEISLPPLRERGEDIHLLFRKFSSDFAHKYKMPPIKLTADAAQYLMQYRWSGNIRQLRNIAEQISVIETNREINLQTIKSYLPERNSQLPSLVETKKSESDFSNEREILYKVLFDMKADLTDLKKLTLELMNNSNASQVKESNKSLIQRIYGQNDDVNTATQSNRSIALGELTSSSSTINQTPIINEADEDDEANYLIAETIDEEETLKLEEKEIQLIKKALERNGGKRKAAADELGISERTLYRKIKQYDL
jgi:DNA-binding NtrC family response regulator